MFFLIKQISEEHAFITLKFKLTLCYKHGNAKDI